MNDKKSNLLGDKSVHDARVLVFLHYFGGSSRTWTEALARFADQYRCLAPDLRGFGDSVATANGDFSVSDYADDVLALVAEENVKSYVLIGHSMGGKIALAVAARSPVNLHSLILLAPSPPTPEPIPDDERKRLLAAWDNRSAIEETIRRTTARSLPTPVFERTVEDDLRSSAAAWRTWLEEGSREDISAQMPQIDVPVTIAAGEMDKTMTEDLLRREVARRIVGARLKTLRGSGHLLPLEVPTETTNLINWHLQRTI